VIRRIILLAVLLSSLISVAQVPVSIRTEGAKARTRPSTRAPIIAALHKGELFVIQDDQPYWYEITLKNGRAAWVRKAVCTIVDQSEDTPEEPGTAPTSASLPAPTSNPACTEVSVPADLSICPATGSGGVYGPAYAQKNRLKVPCSYSSISVDDMLALQHLSKSARAKPDGDPEAQYLKATEAETVMVEGYLAMAKDGGAEGVNCKSTTRVDTHMELVDTDSVDPKRNRDRHVIAEVTPWFHAAVPEWSTEALESLASYSGGYSGSEKHSPPKVRIYGYLFFDEAHATGADSWRGTPWEVHPITKIEVLENGEWHELGGVHP
jgi:hypothetical protein